MKNIPKYKIFYKSKKIINSFPNRLNTFNRTKWKNIRLKNRLQLKIKIIKFNFNLLKKYSSIRNIKLKLKLIKRSKFRNFFSPKIKGGKGSRVRMQMRKYYKNSLIAKTFLLQNFDCSLNFFNLKKDVFKNKSLLYSNLIQNVLIKNNFKLNILLWKLKFFSSTLECAQFINSNFIYVNNKNVTSTYFLKKGDIITFNKQLFNLNLNLILQSSKLNSFFYSFLEIDFYTNTIIIIKDFKELNLEDLSLITSNFINVSHIWNYIK